MSQCENNLKQWGLAMQNYHDAEGHLPLGAQSSPRQTWVMYLWPYIEQTNLSDQNNLLTNEFYEPPCTDYYTMNGLCGIRVPQYDCPTDGKGVEQDDPTGGTEYTRRRGNYLVNWGNAYYNETTATPMPPGCGPFYQVYGENDRPGVVRLTDITDGLSDTLMMSEYLKALVHTDTDWRGDIHNDQGVSKFMTITTPNSTIPDWIGSADFVTSNTDPLMPAIPGDDGDNQFAAVAQPASEWSECPLVRWLRPLCS